MGDYKPVRGDRVRVVIEGEVGASDGTYFVVRQDDDFAAEFKLDAKTSVEKVEPPVVQFQPGDTVRYPDYPTHIYSIGEGGYYSHYSKEWRPGTQRFASDRFEKVDL